MKTTTPKKKEDNTIVVTTPLPRMPRIAQRGKTHKSKKRYTRKGKRVEQEDTANP